ncbi:glycosyl transferase possibly involved in lipopolysaccharide synthesis [Sphaerochaeta pleomorpha str. Grapes]|uniref:Glycosyl transferase possibly involved in lipopolysaccharide synthesis n=1 Tax=Sphaerochaeta pleomorpha (strain ATCC BAA-1885 / DSM 22778 / Grapes) TaxID=158190 RepID=G8QW94_SPHPG|nr:sugar transferase [Sphaerochaeta pleomorpha]AEV29392.1 glycosyl transferase possibly involved in lipopolysaccharide synthesis [Sphaerochaeta pleomorpha str. Grapes]
MMYEKHVKRILDILCSLSALIVFFPVLVFLVLLVRIKLGSPVFFRQLRPGLHEQLFTLYKFRTMTDKKDAQGALLPDSERLTTFGKKLRATSLDELPELLNILLGDMSLVGPRPLLVRDMAFMSDDQRRRHGVKPGLTGLAQINGRNAISWDLKLQFDLAYLEHISFYRDFSILCKTFGNVLKEADITEEGMVTAQDFGDYLREQGRIDPTQYGQKMLQAKIILMNHPLPEQKHGSVRTLPPQIS